MKHKMISAIILTTVLLAATGSVIAQDLQGGYDGAGTISQDNDPAAVGGSPDPAAAGGSHGTATLDVGSITRQLEGQVLGGDEGTACEAILCLATGSPPGQCAKSLARYFGITDPRPHKMIQKRLNFLQMCPSSNSSPQMGSLVNAMAHGAGRCDAASLNQTQRIWNWTDSRNSEYSISDQWPAHCDAYYNHEYTDLNPSKPRYIGTPETEGFWADGQNYASALAEYEARQEALREQQNRDSWYGGGY